MSVPDRVRNEPRQPNISDARDDNGYVTTPKLSGPAVLVQEQMQKISLTALQNSEEIMNNTQTLITALENAPDIIISLVREVPPQNLKRRPGPNKWSAHEHACHIFSADPIYLSRLDLMLSDPAPYIRSVVPSPEEEAGSLLNIDLEEALNQYLKVRVHLVKRLKMLSAEDWQRKAEHEAFSHYSVMIMFRELLMHEMHHAYRIEELLLKKEWE